MQPKAKFIVFNGGKETPTGLWIIEPLNLRLRSFFSRYNFYDLFSVYGFFDSETSIAKGLDFWFDALRQSMTTIMKNIHIVGQARPTVVQRSTATHVVMFCAESAENSCNILLYFGEWHYLAKLWICLPSLKASELPRYMSAAATTAASPKSALSGSTLILSRQLA